MRLPLAARAAALLLLVSTAAPAAESRHEAWESYRTILWLSGNTARQAQDFDALLAVLREMGINTGMVSAGGGKQAERFTQAGFPFYIENAVSRGLSLKYHSKVTDWNNHITEWMKTRDEAAFVREPSLDDPKWLQSSLRELRDLARRMAPYRPIAYNLRDELSTTFSANPFDYDFSPHALGAFREWLRREYKTLEALNAGWDTSFESWDAVEPYSTDRIKARMTGPATEAAGQPDWPALARMKFDPAKATAEPRRWNFAPWCDFRTYMDHSLATRLGELSSAIREVDPKPLVGIEGTQMPSAWGGYNLATLSRSLGWVEPYDIGNAREIWGSFMKGRPILTTLGEKDVRQAKRRLWHLLLQGDHGCIVWWSEDCIAFRDGAPALTDRAKALAPILKGMTSPLAQLFLRAERELDPVHIHYSQPSIQVDWLLESTVDGRTWPRRFSSFEAPNNKLAAARNGWLKALQDLGYSPSFISESELPQRTSRALLLPGSLALSAREVAHLQQPGRALIADVQPGLFDEHGRLRAAAPELSVTLLEGAAAYAKDRRSRRPASDFARRLAAALGDVRPPMPLDPAARLALFRYKLGAARLLAFERNVDYRMSESLEGAGGNEALEEHVTTLVRLPEPGHVYDLRTNRYLGLLQELSVTVDPWQPSLFAVLKEKLEGGSIVDALSVRVP